jgi:deferrochelatase/peroxidase EfeB
MPSTSGQPDKANVQGLIMRGYSHPFSCHMLFKFPDKMGASKFVTALLPYLQDATQWAEKPKRMLNIGLTYNGVITVKPSLAGHFFSPSFTEGPASSDPNGPQASLFDLGASAPENWWYKKFATDDIHAVVHVYALTSDDLTSLVTLVADAAEVAGVTELFPLESGSGRLEQCELPDETVYFGYRDGIDNPDLGWPSDPSHTTSQDLNNFLIGYPPYNAGPTRGEAACSRRTAATTHSGSSTRTWRLSRIFSTPMRRPSPRQRISRCRMRGIGSRPSWSGAGTMALR